MYSECDDDGSFICQLDGADDSILDNLDDHDPEDNVDEPENENNKDKSTQISIINTNARSLCPKIESLIDCCEEMDVTLGIVTETWLTDGDSLERDIHDLAKGAGLDMICLNRPPGNRGNSHGGVAVVCNRSNCTISKLDYSHPENFEV